MTWGTASPRQGQLMPGHPPQPLGMPRGPCTQASPSPGSCYNHHHSGEEFEKGRPHQLPLPMAEASGIWGVQKGSHPWEAARGVTHEAQMVKNFKTVMAEKKKKKTVMAEHQTF